VTRLLAPPLSLYIHLPWCVRKCPYCDFNSHQAEHLPEAEYIAALERDLDRQLADRPEPRPLQSIFFGGGTPSLFSAPGIEAILNAVHRRMKLADDAEITLEANPGTAEQRRFRDYRSAGINRLSIGVQSFDDDLLRALGRIHDGEQARRAVHSALAAGLEHINIDLMHGLPGQTLPMALADLDQALALGTGHLSWYQLTIEPNTAFYSRPPRLPDEDDLADITDAGLERLARQGLQRYEVSAYARSPGQRSRHNLNYWRFGDYLGLGAGAHGKLSSEPEQRILRYQSTRLPADYMARAGQAWPVHAVAESQRIAEYMLNALRLVEGFTPEDFEQRTGLAWRRVSPRLDELCRRGLLQPAGSGVRPTPRGMDFLNELIGQFLS